MSNVNKTTTVEDFIHNFFDYQVFINQVTQRLDSKFPKCAGLPITEKISLLSYAVERPNKFFDLDVYRKADAIISRWICSGKVTLPTWAVTQLESALNVLRSTNQSIQEFRFSGEDPQLLEMKMRDEVFAKYVQIAEYIYGNLLAVLLILHYEGRNLKVPSKLSECELIDRVSMANRELKLTTAYDHSIRNAITHGGVEFLEYDVKFSDSNRPSQTMTLLNAERIAERLLDVCNGIAVAMFENAALGGTFSKIGPIETNRILSLIRGPFLRPEAAYVHERHDGPQVSIYGTCSRWRLQDLWLDIGRAFAIAKHGFPNAGNFVISFKDSIGMPYTYRLSRQEIPSYGDKVEALFELSANLPKAGIGWVLHKRLAPRIISRSAKYSILLNWADSVDLKLDLSKNDPDYELRELANKSVQRHSRFEAKIISRPRQQDLDEFGMPTIAYLDYLFQQTLQRWMVRDVPDPRLDNTMIRYYRTCSIFVYKEDYRIRDLSKNDDNLLFRFELPILPWQRLPPFFEGTTDRIGMYWVAVNPKAASFLKNIATQAGHASRL